MKGSSQARLGRLRRRNSWISSEGPRRNESEAIGRMLDPIVLPTLYFIAVLELIFQAGVVFYAYKVTRITGSFRAWTMIIVAFSLLTIQSSTVTAITGALLFLGVFGLAKRFESQAKPSA